MISLEEILKYVSYDPESGDFIRIHTNSEKLIHQKLLGKVCGNPSSNGYLEISFNNNNLQAHKLAWYIYYGEYPDFYIDHINGVKTDNRIVNLRKSSALENMRNRKMNKNNTSGVNGVEVTSSGKYRVRIKVKGKLLNLGSFDTLDQARVVREEANKLYDFSERHGVSDEG